MAEQENAPENRSVPPKLKVPQIKRVVDAKPKLKIPTGPIPGVRRPDAPKAPKTVTASAAFKRPSADDDSSSQTIHIQLPDLDEDTSSSVVSPAPVAGDVSAVGAAPKTIKLKAPPNVQVKKFATGIVEAEAKEEGVSVKTVAKGGKSYTSKGSLPDLKSSTAAIGPKRSTGAIPGARKKAPGVVGASQTVRITPLAADGNVPAAPVPGSDPLPAGHEAPSPAQKDAEKRKTSRISLEAALSGTDESSSDQSRPKTIRLKRPSEAATVKVKRVVPPSVASTASATKTAEIAEPGEGDGVEAPMTRRKTIRVKRPTRAAGAPSLPKPPSGDGQNIPDAAVQASVLGMQSAVKPETMNVVFPIFAVLTILTSLVAIWLFVSQACGPNDSLTELSTLPSPDLPWVQN